MIFVTVGTQLPFDRLLQAVDAWAATQPQLEFFAQTGPGAWAPRHMPHAEFVSPSQAETLFVRAQLVVSHAGMGSVLTALGHRKPILLLPRRAALGEHRNEHQMATARWLQGRPGLYVAWDEDELRRRLEAMDALQGGPGIEPHAPGALVERLRAFIRLDAGATGR